MQVTRASQIFLILNTGPPGGRGAHGVETGDGIDQGPVHERASGPRDRVSRIIPERDFRRVTVTCRIVFVPEQEDGSQHLPTRNCLVPNVLRLGVRADLSVKHEVNLSWRQEEAAVFRRLGNDRAGAATVHYDHAKTRPLGSNNSGECHSPHGSCVGAVQEHLAGGQLRSRLGLPRARRRRGDFRSRPAIKDYSSQESPRRYRGRGHTSTAS